MDCTLRVCFEGIRRAGRWVDVGVEGALLFSWLTTWSSAAKGSSP